MFHQTSPSFLGLAIECAPLTISLSIVRLRDSSSSPLMSLKTLNLNLAVSIAHQRERVAWVLETSKERTIIVKQDKFRDLGIRTDPWLLVFFLWFQVQNRMSRSATASKRQRKRYRLCQRYQYCLKNLCIPAEAPIPESSVDYQRWSDETDDKVI